MKLATQVYVLFILIFKLGFHPPKFRGRVTKIPVQCSRYNV